MYTAKTFDIEIAVEPQFLPNQSDPSKQRWFWAYSIVISNLSDQDIRLRERHWVITNALGNVETVHGPGVVGEEPLIVSGAHYRYTSGCPLNTDSGSMHGYYVMERADGSRFDAMIPHFSLDLPDISRTLN